MRITHSRISRVLAALAAVIIALPPSLPIVASPAMEKLFYILKSKGSLTQDEYDMLVAAMRADEKKGSTAVAPASGSSSPSLERRLAQTESKVGNLENVITNTKGQVEEISKITDNTSPATMSKADIDVLLADKWYERLKLKGYVQTRLYSLLGDDDVPGVNVANDPFVSDTQSMGIRRGRLVFSGDVTNHLYLYAQMDFFAGVGSTSGGTTTALQARDLYADISLDPAREFRFRLGQSKVPYGWSNLQSSQNRLALERADALNSAVEGERDMGAYLIWAPYEIRERFKNLVKMGLRGSGDYGVLSAGVYNGTGINNNDNNGKMHYIVHAAYPFEFDNGQFFEIGASFYTGNFRPGTAAMGALAAPAVAAHGVRDQRTAVNAILYPQPFGLEAEYTWGKGPQLSPNMLTIASESLEGGYIQACYRHVFPNQSELIPFVRMQSFDGARKFATNAPKNRVNEVAFGMRYVPYPEFEMTFLYSNGTRTNTTDNPGGLGPRYRDVNVSYIGIQAQINF
ncbi:MAG: porin [Prosthecobacter sp.]|uniref:porin n=1 Tax=Prosthecobacter sp. TaxID=1965333 RepID=UPI003902BEE8